MKVVVNEGSRGFLFKDGKFVKMLGAGKYSTSFGKKIFVAKVTNGKVFVGQDVENSVLVQDEEFVKQTVRVDVLSGYYKLHFVDGILEELLMPGKYYFWNIDREHSFIDIDLSNPEFSEDIPEYIFNMSFSNQIASTFVVGEKEKGLLFFDNKFQRFLEPGVYHFVKGKVLVTVKNVETCLLAQDIVGQEILTADKVSIRVNVVCEYRVSDCFKAVTELDDYKEHLHVAVQLALRDYIGERTLDQILASRQEMSKMLTDCLSKKQKELFIEIKSVAVKDIILPGEVREIMNTVLVAEKRAQANVITRREEVASTRSLLNTAKLMDENETLYRLKELEYIEKICENVESISLNSGSDLLAQLANTLSCTKNSKK